MTTANASTTSPGDKNRLSGQLGTAGVVFMVVAAAAPLTVVSGNTPLAIGLGNGAAAPLGFIFASIVLLIFSVGFVAMTPYVKEAGAFFTYVGTGLGARAGQGTAFVALITYTAIQLGIYGFFGWAANDTVVAMGGPALPWWLYAAASLIAVAALGYRHIELSSKVLGVALILEISVVLIMNVAIVAEPSGSAMSSLAHAPTAPAGAGPFGIAVLFGVTGFIGFEATAVFRDEARDPNRTIPRATYLAVLIIGAFYTVSCWCLVHAWGPATVRQVANQYLGNGGNMVLDTARFYTGHALADLMQLLLLTSLMACILSFHNIVARYQFVLANFGILPRAFAASHSRHGSPHISSLVQTVTAIVLVALCAISGASPLVGVFGSMAGIATVGIVMLMLLTSIAAAAFFFKAPHLAPGRALTTRWMPVAATALLAFILYLVLANFTTVTGLGVGISTLLAIIPMAAFAIGMVAIKKSSLASLATLSHAAG
ncbi:APC family permease [Salinisphaera hydrothermalis]|uniref:Amino acid permease-associated protein n=1 Tax=Salinisphaera hydrothermalis (strain C41B8) TaxID=1304275 RepID=A0A084IRM0_SALHC|nr:APC family permease [Salinisphaera hydrothermalis]KEZ79354.1 amino acid permease-associated protein [Salinisphaera hydrothermalis C41B8]